MTFTLTINCENAVFEDNCNAEVARILRRVATDIEEGNLNLPDWALRSQYQTLFDINGNDVGRASYLR